MTNIAPLCQTGCIKCFIVITRQFAKDFQSSSVQFPELIVEPEATADQQLWHRHGQMVQLRCINETVLLSEWHDVKSLLLVFRSFTLATEIKKIWIIYLKYCVIWNRMNAEYLSHSNQFNRPQLHTVAKLSVASAQTAVGCDLLPPGAVGWVGADALPGTRRESAATWGGCRGRSRG